MAWYERAIAMLPSFAHSLSHRGNAWPKLGRLDEAVASQELALLHKPDFNEVFCNCGNALHLLERVEDAVFSCKQTIALRPADVEA